MLLETTDELLDEYEATLDDSERLQTRTDLALPEGHKYAARFMRSKRTDELRLVYPWFLKPTTERTET